MKLIKKGQRVILVSLALKAKASELKENLEELRELALAVELYPLYSLQKNLRFIDSAFLISSGKRRELADKVQQLKPDYVIFDHSLTGVQSRNLEKLLKVPVLDRTQLILEIFAQRAQSHEGKLQVELAQLMDQMPRMVGAWLGSLSRQSGGRGAKVGPGRGPGEKALETDRRQAQQKIKKIKEKLEKVKRNRSQRRHKRVKKKLPSFALMGYTNSGKSTLLNLLTKSKTETKDQAFMTLDPKTRKVFIPSHSSGKSPGKFSGESSGEALGGSSAVITDTVGFIRELPAPLIEAFKATLEESASADILLHVVDVAHPNRQKHIQVVEDLIEEFGWSKKPCIRIFNKTDLLSPEEIVLPRDSLSVGLSAKTGHNVQKLLSLMKQSIEKKSLLKELFFSKQEEHKIYDLSRTAKILKKEQGRTGTYCQIQIPADQLKPWEAYMLKNSS